MDNKTANSMIIKTMGLPMDNKAQDVHDKLISHLEKNAKDLGGYDSIENYLDSVRNDTVKNVPEKLLNLYEHTIKDINFKSQKSLFEAKTEILAKAAMTLISVNKLAPGVSDVVTFNEIKYAIENGV